MYTTLKHFNTALLLIFLFFGGIHATAKNIETGSMKDGKEIVFSATDQEKHITFSGEYDAVGVKGQMGSIIMFSSDTGENWHVFNYTTDTHDSTASALFSELHFLENPSSTFQFRVIGKEMKTVPFFFIKNSDLSGVYASGETIEHSYAPYVRDEWFFEKYNIIRREEWGANEAYRYTWGNSVVPSTGGNGSKTQRQKECDARQEEYPQDFEWESVVRSDENGDLVWNYQYSADIKRVLIHHTASDIRLGKEDRTPEEIMRATYIYHANGKKWGDIGYHFVIGPNGEIFEGRAGGDFVVGGHAYCANSQSIGIALMGNFENERPSERQVYALKVLLEGISDKYNIDLGSESVFHGELSPNLAGHKDYTATACPGENLYELIPYLRTSLSSNSSTASTPSPANTPLPTPTPTPLTSSSLIPQTKTIGEESTLVHLQSNIPNITVTADDTTITFTAEYQNIGSSTWDKNSLFLKAETGGLARFIRLDTNVLPADYAIFTGSIQKRSDSFIRFTLTTTTGKAIGKTVEFNTASSSTRENITEIQEQNPSSQPSQIQAGVPLSFPAYPAPTKDIRIKLSYTGSLVQIRGDMMRVEVGKTAQVNKKSRVVVSHVGESLYFDGKPVEVIRIRNGFVGDPLTISSWSRPLEWNTEKHDNTFLGVLEIRLVDGELTVINELPLEDYIQGIAEVSNTAPAEKQKAIAVIARSYAQFYMDPTNIKFPGKPYHGDDSPERFQKYRGYGYMQRSPKFIAAVESTRGQVVTYNGELIKTPYFSESDGRTRSGEEVWGWKDTPYLQSKDDTFCKDGDGVLWGHGVGLSGCGAEYLAQQGYSYRDIIAYYYTGVEIR